MVKPSSEPLPAHVASFDVYTTALDTGYLGADFSADMSGAPRFVAPAVFTRDIPFAEHSDRQAMQLVRDILTYTAKRIETGRATVVGPSAVALAGSDRSYGARPLGLAELQSLGIDPSSNWEAIRPVVADGMIGDFLNYRDSLVDGLPGTASAIQNLELWASVLQRAGREVAEPVIVSDVPRLLPGVEPIGIVVDPHGGPSRMRQSD